MKETILAKEIRLLGYTQQEFAIKNEIAINSVSSWITGNRKISGKMVRILKKAGITTDAIAEPTKEVEV